MTRQALSAEVIGAGEDFAPPTILARAARLTLSARGQNLLVTNVPGPQSSVYVLGRRLERVFPIPALAGDHALAVAVMSYDGGMDFGLLGDYDALPDLDAVAVGIAESLAELLGLAGGPLTRREDQDDAHPRAGAGEATGAMRRTLAAAVLLCLAPRPRPPRRSDDPVASFTFSPPDPQPARSSTSTGGRRPTTGEVEQWHWDFENDGTLDGGGSATSGGVRPHLRPARHLHGPSAGDRRRRRRPTRRRVQHRHRAASRAAAATAAATASPAARRHRARRRCSCWPRSRRSPARRPGSPRSPRARR